MKYLSTAYGLLVAGALLLPAPAFALVPAILDDSFGCQLAGPVNVSVWWCEATYKVGRDRAAPLQAGSAVQISAARNEYEPFQIVLNPDSTLSNLNVSISDFVHINDPAQTISSNHVEIMLVEYVPVIEPSAGDGESIPGDWPDPLPPFTNGMTVAASTNQPFWFSVYVPKNTPAGEYEAQVSFAGDEFTPFSITVLLQVRNFSLSDITHTDSAFADSINIRWHYAFSTDAQREVWDLYLQDFKKHRITPQAPHQYDMIRWQYNGSDYIMDFSDFDEAMTRYLDEFGFTSFNLFDRSSTVFPPSSLAGYYPYTPEYRKELNKLLGKIMQHLREKGWADKAYIYEYDELASSQYPTLFSWLDAVQEAAPDLRRLYTTNYAYEEDMEGRVDIWVPIMPAISIYSQFESRKQYGDELWWYVAVGPRSPYANRFIDHPAINTRIHYWAAEKYGITGDLYWANSFWPFINPWEETRTSAWWESNGDGILYYPPTRQKPADPVVSAAVPSVRWELLREALEDAEYFWLLKKMTADAELRLGPDHPAITDAYNAYDASVALITNLTAFAKDVDLLMEAREDIALAIEDLNDGTPFFVRSPSSKAVEAGGTVKLYAEAIGWPLPEYQWQLNGMDLAGETNSVLVLTNCGPSELGAYTVVAGNNLGEVVSDEAVLGGYWSLMPDIISQPEPVIQHEGETAVLVVTAVSSNDLSYQWLRDGLPVPEAVSTNTTLLLTNLTASLSGDYSVIVSNSAGSVTSDVAQVTVLWNPYTEVLISTGDSWRYHAEGIDPGSSWRNAGYDDSGWQEGNAPLGFGNSNEVTVVAPNAVNKPRAVYFRKKAMLSEMPVSETMSGKIRADDGVVGYLNGTEVFRYNMPAGAVDYDTSASSAIEGVAEAQWIYFSVPADSWVVGENVIAVEVHQFSEGMDLSDDLVSLWPLDESGTPWPDHVGTNDFQAVGTGLTAGPGVVDGCVTGTTSSSWLEAPDAAELRCSGPFTVGGWFAWHDWTYQQEQTTCLEKENEFRLYYTGAATNRYRFRVGGVEVQNETGGTAQGQWRFLVAWYDGTNACIQIDDGTVYSVAAPYPAATANPLRALKMNAPSGSFSADELFFYRRTLSGAERTDIYTTGIRAMLESLAGEDLTLDMEAGTELIQRPVFVESPSSQTRWEGQTAAFRGEALSKTTFTYQWTFNGNPIPGATDPLFARTGVTSNDVGQYVLQALNSAGASDSGSAGLSLYSRPSLQGLSGLGTNGFEIVVPPNTGTWRLLASSNLIHWAEIGSVPPGTDPITMVDGDATNEPVRFYRLELQ